MPLTHGNIKNTTPTNPGNQKINQGQNFTINPVIDRPTFWDTGQSTVKKQNFGLISDSHLKENQILADPSESAITEDISDKPSTSDINDLYHDKNARGGKCNSWPNPNLNYSDIGWYWKRTD